MSCISLEQREQEKILMLTSSDFGLTDFSAITSPQRHAGKSFDPGWRRRSIIHDPLRIHDS